MEEKYEQVSDSEEDERSLLAEQDDDNQEAIEIDPEN